jgi:phosphoribosylformylglycinamidine synthase subunit PurL
MVGVIDDVDHVTTLGSGRRATRSSSSAENTDELGGSEYLKVVHGLVAGDAPAVDLDAEHALQRAVLAAIRRGRPLGARRARGRARRRARGVAIADGERPFGVDVGARRRAAARALLFGEAQGRVVLSCAPEALDGLLKAAAEHGVPAARIGTVGAPDGAFRIRTERAVLEASIADLAHVYGAAIPRRMDGVPAEVAVALESPVENG